MADLRWAREAAIVAIGVVVAVLSAWLPSFQGGLVRGLAIASVALGLALVRRLEPPAKVAATAPADAGARAGALGVGPLADVDRASGVVVVGGRERGARATLLAEGLAVTSASAVARAGSLVVRFWTTAGQVEVKAARRAGGDGMARLGIAVLDLAGEPPVAPPPAGLWPARRLPAATVVPAEARPGGPASHGTWQPADLAPVDENGLASLLAPGSGHRRSAARAGAPVCDPATGLVVGVVVIEETAGRRGEHGPEQVATLEALRRAGVALPRPWLMAGESPRSHFTQRAQGQRSAARGGDVFQGRDEARRVVRRWTSLAEPPGTPLVITAQPGGGKSAVLARALLEAEAAGDVDGLGFHARQATIDELVDAVAAACGVPTPGSWRELAQELAALRSPAPVVIMVDALDEATGNDIAEMRRALRDLARFDWVRVVVATRPLAPGDRFPPGGHLHALGVVRGPASRNLVDLDTDRFFVAADLHAYAATMLTQAGFARQGPPGAAWEAYGADPDLCSRLAATVAEQAQRNHLVAGMSALLLAEDDDVVDPAAPGFDPATIPTGVGEALSKHLERLPAGHRRRDRDLLTALAYARGQGLDDDHWISFARALGRAEVVPGDIDALREGSAADLLLESTSDASGRPLTRLFHQALADELLAGRRIVADERALLAAQRDASPTGSWLDASTYARHAAAAHAATAGVLEQRLAEADFLVGMSPSSLRSALAGTPLGSRADPATVYHLALRHLAESTDRRGANAEVLALIARTQGNVALANDLAELPVDRLGHVTGRLRPLDVPLARFDGHTARVRAITCLPWPGRSGLVVVTASLDGTARVWDPHHPDRELARFDGHTGEVLGVTAVDWPGLDHRAVVTSSVDGTARVWDPLRSDEELARLDHDAGPVWSVAAVDGPGRGEPIVVTGAEDGVGRVWNALRPGRELARFTGHTGSVTTVTSLPWPGRDHPVVMTGSWDGTAQVWDPQQPVEALARFDGHTAPVMGIAVLTWPGLDHPVVATTSRDWTVRVWDPHQPSEELARFDQHTDRTAGVTSLPWPGLDHPVVATVSSDATARIWDPVPPVRELARFEGHPGAVTGVVSIDRGVGRRHLLVTAAVDGAARVWDPDADATAPGSRFAGHTARVWDVAALRWPDPYRRVLLTTSSDGTARVWDVWGSGRELVRFAGHTSWVVRAGALRWPGLDHPAVVTTSYDGMALVWDPRQPDRELARFERHTGPIWGLTTIDWPGLGHPAVVTTAEAARVWDPVRPERDLARFDGHAGDVRRAVCLAWPRLDHPVLVTTGGDGTARVWDPLRPADELARYDGHRSAPSPVTTVTWPGLAHPAVVTGGDDGVHIWDPLRPDRALVHYEGHVDRIMAVACVDWLGVDRPLMITASVDSIRVWEPRTPPVEVAQMPAIATPYAVVGVDPGRFVVATDRGFLVVDLQRGVIAGSEGAGGLRS